MTDRVVVLLVAVLLCVPSPVHAQGTTAPQDPSIQTNLDASEIDSNPPPPVVPLALNQYAWKGFSLRWGGGFLYDYAGYDQDEVSKSQMNISGKADLRDFRVLLKGQLAIPQITYSIGYMYDKNKETWRFRQTGIMVDIRKAYGNLFVGRTKEGFSTSKIMVGYQGWTNERSTMNDALIPILADGIKWTGSVPKGRLVYNIGWFPNQHTDDESFDKHDESVAGRVVWLPWADKDRGVLHIAFEARHARANNGTEIQYRSKPESYFAQSYAIDTGKFTGESANAYGFETYYRPGPTTVGMEYFFTNVKAPESGNPMFHGGDVIVTHTLTGETKPYNARGAFFDRTTPARSVFSGGPGAWELVGRFSYSDMDDHAVHGGKFWRFTPMVNWYLSGNVRLEFVYGYSSLNRFGVVGKTHYFQSRFQFQL